MKRETQTCSISRISESFQCLALLLSQKESLWTSMPGKPTTLIWVTFKHNGFFLASAGRDLPPCYCAILYASCTGEECSGWNWKWIRPTLQVRPVCTNGWECAARWCEIPTPKCYGMESNRTGVKQNQGDFASRRFPSTQQHLENRNDRFRNYGNLYQPSCNVG